MVGYLSDLYHFPSNQPNLKIWFSYVKKKKEMSYNASHKLVHYFKLNGSDHLIWNQSINFIMFLIINQP